MSKFLRNLPTSGYKSAVLPGPLRRLQASYQAPVPVSPKARKGPKANG